LRNLVLYICILGGTVLFHELAHLVVGLYFGIEIESFNIGFGSSVLQTKIGDLIISINWIPLGGYVSISDNYLNYSPVVALSFLSAGIIANILVAIYVLDKREVKDISIKLLLMIPSIGESQNKIQLFAKFSILLGVFNAFPLYPLDGGKIIVYLMNLGINEEIISLYKNITMIVFLIILILLNLPPRMVYKNKLKIESFMFKRAWSYILQKELMNLSTKSYFRSDKRLTEQRIKTLYEITVKKVEKLANEKNKKNYDAGDKEELLKIERTVKEFTAKYALNRQ